MYFVHPCSNNIVKQSIGLAFVEIFQGVRKVEYEEFLEQFRNNHQRN